MFFKYLFAFCTISLSSVSASKRITSYTALGDSYASGDGAGSSKLLPGDSLCGRFSGAYPIWIANSSSTAISPYEFRNAACGGATTLDIIAKQLSSIEDSQIVTLTVGGNEVDFFLILNECIHQWHPISNCDAQLVNSKKKIESGTFISNYNTMVREAVTRLAPGARLLITGYATFFNEVTEQCNTVSFSKTQPQNVLSNELRARFNSLVRLLNAVIRAAAEAHGATYIDIDAVFEGHRFCEEGVVEPADRDDTWFFTLNYDHNRELSRPADIQTTINNPFKEFFDLTRVFHPTGLGHKKIQEEILTHVLEHAT